MAGTGRLNPGTVAALLDLRSIIALMFGVYGIVLTILGLIGTSAADLEKAGGIDINLWSGIVMLVLAAGFGFWVWQRPPLVGEPAKPVEEAGPGH
jgi:hypothetical protein